MCLYVQEQRVHMYHLCMCKRDVKCMHLYILYNNVYTDMTTKCMMQGNSTTHTSINVYVVFSTLQ